MINRNFIPWLQVANFKGVNAKDSQENINDSEWTEDSHDIFSDPQGAVGSRPGYTAITSASVGATTAWCGFYEFHKASSGTRYYLGGASNGKLYQYVSNDYTELYSGLTSGANVRWSFFTLDNSVVAVNGNQEPLIWTGSGSAVTFATSVTADFGLEWQRYGWLHSTADPRLIYYCATLGDPDSAYTSFLNFDDDAAKVTGACKQGDDMLVGKEWGLYRVQYRGSTPLFKKYRIPSKVGPVSHWAMKELPDGKAIFLAPNFNFYMVNGDVVSACGDNIQPYVKDGVNARLKYAVSGLLLNRHQYWCSFSYLSGATTNDRTVVMDWSRPYQDKWGKLQYPWFIYTIGANCFAETYVSGKAWLYHGGYVGKMYKDDTGTNDDGSTFINSYKTKRVSHGDPTLEKKFATIQLNYKRTGDWNLDINIVCDGNANTEKVIAQNMLYGLGYTSLFDVAKFDEDYFSSERDSDETRDINRMGKTLEITMGTQAVDEQWLLYNYAVLIKAGRRTSYTREGGA